jgi:hypothetical protein
VLVHDVADGSVELPAGIRPVATETLMRDEAARRRLARVVLDAAGALA